MDQKYIEQLNTCIIRVNNRNRELTEQRLKRAEENIRKLLDDPKFPEDKINLKKSLETLKDSKNVLKMGSRLSFDSFVCSCYFIAIIRVAPPV